MTVGVGLLSVLLQMMVLTAAGALRFDSHVGNTGVQQLARRKFVSSVLIGATTFCTGHAASAYGIQARPARDFSGANKDDEAQLAKAAAFEFERKAREQDFEAKKARELSARFGTEQEPPATMTKAQEKLARARAEARARAHRD